MKKLFAIISVVLFANQASADQVKLETGDVYYCVQIASFATTATSGNKVRDNSGQKRKLTLKLTDEYLIFKNDSDYVWEAPIIYRTETDVEAVDKTMVFTLTVDEHIDGKIYYATASAYKDMASMGTGECDKFP